MLLRDTSSNMPCQVEGRKFTHPWQPTNRNGWHSVCVSVARHHIKACYNVPAEDHIKLMASGLLITTSRLIGRQPSICSLLVSDQRSYGTSASASGWLPCGADSSVLSHGLLQQLQQHLSP